MAHKHKDLIKAYYQTHNEDSKEVAKRFEIPLRTLNYWILTEKWQKASALNGITQEVLSKNLVKKEFGTAIARESQRIKEKIRYNLGDTAFKVDSMLLENMLEDSTQKLLLGAMSLNYIQQNITLFALIARDELLRLKAKSTDMDKPDVMVVASAEKVQKMFLDLKTAIFGKDALVSTSDNEVDFENMSEAELNALLKG
ncbi:hypothetical protein [Helicobacter sp.]|uniref:hypothetical protein n=1 Tax=Helicobacter sp. TaxID=218 RepID=UPI002A748C7C|nr:hypothetical protein [Helicobacter sp.]MDY2584287.1 hypothetical protein [Helicobacter sp.]